MKKIMFVCTGNTCRSPMAEALLKNEIKKADIDIDIYVFSRGIAVYFPAGASEHAKQVMKEYDIDLSAHKSKLVELKDIENTDVILTMTQKHKQYLLLNFPQYKEKIFTLKEFVEEFGDVEDPFGGEIEEYKSCAESLDELIKKVIVKIRQNV